jgi:3-isopropylmalate/(R)-2-methylmalate dehydratase large subunit
MTTLPLPGRILFLAEDREVIAAQLAGADLHPIALRNEISTDEITPLPSLVFFDERLARHVYTGVKAGDALPVTQGAVQAGKFSVTVAGHRYGKGSSREHSPLAEKMAGIRLVIAASFERIYRQNADNLGLFTSTDFGLIDRIRAGEPIEVEELVVGRDAVTQAVLRAGGLLAYGMARLHAVQPAPALAPGPQTLVAKILARHAVANADSDGALQVGRGCFVRPDLRFIHDIYTAMCRYMLRAGFGEKLQLHQPETILTFEDHFSYAHRSHAHVSRGLLPHVAELSAEHRAFVAEHGLHDHGYAASGEGSEGISHALMAEQYALPGQLIAGTDSHTPHSGALGCLAFGVGTTDMANAMVTGVVRLAVPETLRIELEGDILAGVSAKDIVLHLLARPDLRAGLGIGKVFEFAGPGIAQLDTDARATLTNMTAELGGFSGIVAPDAETQRFIRQRRGIDIVIEPWMGSDPGATYAGVINVDLSALAPMVAAPGDPGNGIDLSALTETVRIDIAYGGSCTAGKREDFDRYHEVLDWAVRHGLSLPPEVTLYLQFGTKAVADYCEAQGYNKIFAKIGAEILQPACGACANCGPGTSVHAEQVTVSAVNRNFPGRFGPGKVWLASPATVAASAIAGELISFEVLQARFAR